MTSSMSEDFADPCMPHANSKPARGCQEAGCLPEPCGYQGVPEAVSTLKWLECLPRLTGRIRNCRKAESSRQAVEERQQLDSLKRKERPLRDARDAADDAVEKERTKRDRLAQELEQLQTREESVSRE